MKVESVAAKSLVWAGANLLLGHVMTERLPYAVDVEGIGVYRLIMEQEMKCGNKGEEVKKAVGHYLQSGSDYKVLLVLG